MVSFFGIQSSDASLCDYSMNIRFVVLSTDQATDLTNGVLTTDFNDSMICDVENSGAFDSFG